MFERVALIGIGLIGSSLSHAMRRGGLARTIVGHAQSEKDARDRAAAGAGGLGRMPVPKRPCAAPIS
jgi:prephenate dehydrogenase